MSRRRWMLYPLPGILVVLIGAVREGGFTMYSLAGSLLFLVTSSALIALVVASRTSTRMAGAAVPDLGAADRGAEPGWSWQAMTRRQEHLASGERLAEIVWDGREFFVDSTRGRPEQSDVLAYCIDVVIGDGPEGCLERFEALAASAATWSPAEREGCKHTVEGFLAAEDPAHADVFIRVRVDETDNTGSSRVRVVLSAGPVPSGVAAAVNRHLSRIDPLVSLPRTARTVISALGVEDRYASAVEAGSGIVEGALLGMVGVRDNGEFADDMLFMHRERLAVSGTSAVGRILRLVLIVLGVLIGLPMLIVALNAVIS